MRTLQREIVLFAHPFAYERFGGAKSGDSEWRKWNGFDPSFDSLFKFTYKTFLIDPAE